MISAWGLWTGVDGCAMRFCALQRCTTARRRRSSESVRCAPSTVTTDARRRIGGAQSVSGSWRRPIGCVPRPAADSGRRREWRFARSRSALLLRVPARTAAQRPPAAGAGGGRRPPPLMIVERLVTGPAVPGLSCLGMCLTVESRDLLGAAGRGRLWRFDTGRPRWRYWCCWLSGSGIGGIDGGGPIARSAREMPLWQVCHHSCAFVLQRYAVLCRDEARVPAPL
jgi:hypothetical protein